MTLATQILIEAYRTLEKSWKHGCIAENAAGEEIYFRDPAAVWFCSYAAVELAAQRFNGVIEMVTPYIHEVINRRGRWGDWLSYEFYEGRTKEEVLAMIGQAIEFSVEDGKSV